MSKKIAKEDYYKVVTVESGWGTDGEEYFSAHVNRQDGRLQYFQRKYTRATVEFALRGYYPLVFTSQRAAVSFNADVVSSEGKVFRCKCRGKIIPHESLPTAYLGRGLETLLQRIVEEGWAYQSRRWGEHSVMAEEVMLLTKSSSEGCS